MLFPSILFIVCIVWFFLTMLFYKKGQKDYDAQVDAFFEEMATPIDMAVEHGPTYDSDSRQYGVLGILCLIYGAFILLLLFIPNPLQARLGILFCGGTILLAGAILQWISLKLRRKNDALLQAEANAAG